MKSHTRHRRLRRNQAHPKPRRGHPLTPSAEITQRIPAPVSGAGEKVASVAGAYPLEMRSASPPTSAAVSSPLMECMVESSLAFQVLGLSEQGRRPEQQDRHLIRRLRNGMWVAAVADGHLEGGARAADTAMGSLDQVLCNYDVQSEAGQATSLTACLHQAFVDIGAHIGCLRLQYHMDMGTTLTMVVLDPHGDAVILHLGDSQVTHLCKGRVSRVTRPHTLSEMHSTQGEWSGPLWLPWNALARWWRRSRQKHILTRSLGNGLAIPDVTTIPLHSGDRLVVSSDGFHNALSRRLIASRLAPHIPLDTGLYRLFRRALRRSRDNITAVGIECLALKDHIAP